MGEWAGEALGVGGGHLSYICFSLFCPFSTARLIGSHASSCCSIANPSLKARHHHHKQMWREIPIPAMRRNKKITDPFKMNGILTNLRGKETCVVEWVKSRRLGTR